MLRWAKAKFLSTPSARRATQTFEVPEIINEISIHALREEGDKLQQAMDAALKISIHALREEGDQGLTLNRTRFEIFLSTPSARRATHSGDRLFDHAGISIHALREEGDLLSLD